MSDVEKVARPCTCYPSDNPPKPCPQKYALQDCRAAASAALPPPPSRRSRVRAADYLDAVYAPPAPASGKSRLARMHRAPKNTPETEEAASQVHSEDRPAEEVAETPTQKGPAR